MILSKPTARITAKCTCGRIVEARNDAAARLMLAGKPVMCDQCRRDGRHWTKASYQDYLQTDHWKRTREAALKRAGHKCQVCGRRSDLQVHHNDYSRLGGELPTDLVVLCKEHHELFHYQP